MPYFFSILLLFFCGDLVSQPIGFQLPKGKDKIEIPFTLQNGFIVISLEFNQSLALEFIYDTGSEHSILTKKPIAELLDLDFVQTFELVGADLSTVLTAYLVRGVELQIAKSYTIHQNILVFAEDYFRFEAFTGTPIHGILGNDVFRFYTVLIDYQREKLVLYRPRAFNPKKGNYSEVPLTILRGKPYTLVNVNNQGIDQELRLLVDTGAAVSLLLNYDKTDSLNMPSNVIEGNIGYGLGGELNGLIGKTDEIKIGSYAFSSLLTSYQETSQLTDAINTTVRNGILGNQLLERFTVVLDFTHEKMYLKPNKNFKRKIRYDRSGIAVVAGGPNLNDFTIQFIIKDSPADMAGLKKGDKVLKINHLSTILLGLNGINQRLSKKPETVIKMLIKRNGKRIKVKFRLKELF